MSVGMGKNVLTVARTGGSARAGLGTAARRARRPLPGVPGGLRARLVGIATSLAPLVAGLLALALAGLGAVAWSRPATGPVMRTVPLQQRAAMTYDTPVAAGPAYPRGRVTTGDPVFLTLVKSLDVHLDYRVAAGATSDVRTRYDLSDLRGTRRVMAELRSSGGWHRGFELSPRTAFGGARSEADVRLDLDRVRVLASDVERATGVHDRYSLSVRTEVALAGTVHATSGGIRSDAAVRRTFLPELTFTYDGRSLVLADRPAGLAGPVIGNRVTGLEVPTRAGSRLGTPPLTSSVTATRVWAPALALLLLLAAAAAERHRRTARRTERDRVVRRIVLDDPEPARDRIRR